MRFFKVQFSDKNAAKNVLGKFVKDVIWETKNKNNRNKE